MQDSMQRIALGLSTEEAATRMADYRRSHPQHTRVAPWIGFMRQTVSNPLILLLIFLCAVSIATGDVAAASMIAAMIIIGVVMRYVQETRSERAVQALQDLVTITATVLRDGAETQVDIEQLVPGDVIRLSAGDIVPADVQLLTSDDLHVDQHILTGESLPVEKSAAGIESDDPMDNQRLCFQGSTVQTGYATALVTAIGSETYFGSIAASVRSQRTPTAFDEGMRSFTWLMLSIILVLVPVVFLLNGMLRGDWFEALLYALAVAVGITPEMLPMIVSVNLAKGAVAMARRNVIVKQLNAIQNLGAMDVLCTDKTGTLTQGRVVLMHHVGPDGIECGDVLKLGYLNSYFEAGLTNMMDEAVLSHANLEQEIISEGWIKLDEQPFDFERRRLSVLVRHPEQLPLIICKGALEEVLACCDVVPSGAVDVAEHLNTEGFRIVAVATREMPDGFATLTQADETQMTLRGYLAFLDPPKESASAALQELAVSHVDVKILTGDRLPVSVYVAQQVGLPIRGTVVGSQIDAMLDAELAVVVERTTIFAKLTPIHKERIIAQLRANGHVVGFLGDGINDAPALRRADVGISVDEAVDVAKESSDIVLMEHNLSVLHDGVIEGRRVFGNVVKYLRMAASSNVGNMLSVVGASVLLPFLPMLPVQIMLNNLLYDISQTSIPTDTIDEEWLRKPRRWSMREVRSTIMVFGPISSFFDYLTFAVLIWPLNAMYNAPLFHTGWFIESLLSQTLIVYILRSQRMPWQGERPSRTLVVVTLAVVAVGVFVPYSALASGLGFVALPFNFWLWIAVILVAYLACGTIAQRWISQKTSR
jgi:Mg2+-importing ATPase